MPEEMATTEPAVAMTPTQWQEMLTAVTTAVTMNMAGLQQQQQQQYAAAAPPPYVPKSGNISGRHIHLGKFQGTLSAWDDWSWQFKNVVISQNSNVAQLMTEAEVTSE